MEQLQVDPQIEAQACQRLAKLRQNRDNQKANELPGTSGKKQPVVMKI